jgi:hypothetical protein
MYRVVCYQKLAIDIVKSPKDHLHDILVPFEELDKIHSKFIEIIPTRKI